jgi:hypothetical protein
MVGKCANPSCGTSFRYFRGGKLFVFEPHNRNSTESLPNVEHFWLCERCAPEMTIALDEQGHATLESVDRDDSAA